MTELIRMEAEDDEPTQWPSYSDAGRILVAVYKEVGLQTIYRWEADVLDYDNDTSVHWINEGTGIEWFLDDVDFVSPGVWVVEGITGTYFRGDSVLDDDEEWEYQFVRPATAEEIQDGMLADAFCALA